MEGSIFYKFQQLDLTQFAMFEDNFDCKKDTDININCQFQFSYDRNASIVCCTISTVFKCNESMIIKAELNSFFELKEDTANKFIKENSIVLPKGILINFASLGYGSLRGVIYAKTINTPLSRILLPPAHINDIIKEDLVIEFD